MSELTAASAEFDHALGTVDRRAAVELVERLLAAGTDPVSVLIDVIATGQRTVGLRWQRGEWSVAEEHAATGVAVAATEAVGRHVQSLPITHGRVVVACAEREWHALPALLVGHGLRAAGWEVTVLGAATSPVRLSRLLQDLGPDATAVSCSVLAAVPTTRRFIEASTGVGIPILAGGSALGPDPARATALGATAWAPHARAASEALAQLPASVPAAAPLPEANVAEQAAIDVAHDEIAIAVTEQWTLATSVFAAEQRSVDEVAAILGDVVGQALAAVTATLLCGDARILPETAVWVDELLTARGVDTALVVELGGALARGLRQFPLAQELVRRHWAVAHTVA